MFSSQKQESVSVELVKSFSPEAAAFFKQEEIDPFDDQVFATGYLTNDRVVGHFCEMPNVRSFTLSAHTDFSSSLIGIVNLQKLEEIHIGDNAVDADFVGALAKLPLLKKLSLVNSRLSSEAFEKLGMLEGLESLDLGFTNVGMEGFTDVLKHVATLKNLKTLGLGFTFVDAESIKVLSNMRGLKELSIPHSSKIGAEALHEIARIVGLECLHISGCPVGTIKALDGHKTLREISLGNPDPPDQKFNLNPEETCETLAALPNLNTINLTPSEYNSAAFQKLLSANGLTTIREEITGRENQELMAWYTKRGRDDESTRSFIELLEKITEVRLPDRSRYT